jgi:hypothetical protein
MVFRGKKFLTVLLALAAAAPTPAAFSQVRSFPVDAHVELPTGLGSSFSAPAFSASALNVPALMAAPSASLPTGLSAPMAAPAIHAAALPVAAAPAAVAARAVAAPAFTVSAAASDGPASSRPSAETQKAAADALFDASAAAPGQADAVPGFPSASTRELGPKGPRNDHAASPIPLDPDHRAPSLRDRVRDQGRYWKLLSRSFWWYMFTHVKDMWPSYKSRWQKARAEGPVAVSESRAFFASMRVTGMSGRFYALGGSALSDDLVIHEFRGAFARFFDGPGIGAAETAALERFMARAKLFNAEKRAHTNMYKNIRDPLIKASTMRPDQLTAYFDSLLPPAKEEAVQAYQKTGRMETTRDAFLKVLRATLDEEDPSDPHRIRAAIVLGSFANDSAGPGSDFDVEALANGASNKNLAAFSARLVAAWTAAGYHQTNPVTVHDNASWPSWGLVNIIQTRHYIVVSPEAPLENRLSRQAYEDPAVQLERGYTVRGRFNRLVQYAIVGAATLSSDLDAALGRAPSSSGH